MNAMGVVFRRAYGAIQTPHHGLKGELEADDGPSVDQVCSYFGLAAIRSHRGAADGGMTAARGPNALRKNDVACTQAWVSTSASVAAFVSGTVRAYVLYRDLNAPTVKKDHAQGLGARW